ncbi:MAG: hypothetical protein L3J82_01640 [Planctomycetes bacterium]|nr:hypothetical protein [Planctomycetota bacterium]
METKNIRSTIIIGFLGCIALMLSVVGGLYAYNTFIADSTPVQAQTDSGKNWSVTNVRVGGDTDLIVVISEEPNPLDENNTTKQMAVYEVKQQGESRARLYLVGARTLEYDFKFPDISDQSTKGNKYTPIALKKAAEEIAKKRARKKKD